MRLKSQLKEFSIAVVQTAFIMVRTFLNVEILRNVIKSTISFTLAGLPC